MPEQWYWEESVTLWKYYAFTNKVDGLPNRAKCDQYILDWEKDLLPGRFSCVVFSITNLREENRRLGRASGDQMLKDFAGMLTSIFVPSEQVFVGYNGSGQYLVFAEGLSQEQAKAGIEQLHTVVDQQCEEKKLQDYSYGWTGMYGRRKMLFYKKIAVPCNEASERKRKG